MKSYRVKNETGQVFEVDEDKVGQAEQDGYLPVVSNGKDEHRVSFADLPKAQADGFNPWNDVLAANEADLTKMAAHKAEQTPASIAVRSVARGLSGGFLDEGVGALGAVVDQIKGTDKTFGESYEANRDEQRLKHNADDIDNPIATTVGRIGGGIVTGVLLPGAATFGGSVGYGALQGAGESDREGLDMLKDASIGGAFGAGGYGVGKVVAAAPGLIKDGASRFGTGVRAASREMMQPGPANEALIDTAITVVSGGTIPAPLRVFRGLKAGWNESKALAAAQGEFDDVTAALAKTFGPGSATDLSQTDVLMQKLLEEGIAGEPNAAHKLVASKFAAAHGGNADQYLSLLKHSPDDLNAARAFNPIQAGEELAPTAQYAFNDVRKAAGDQYGKLKELARGQFPAQDTSPVRVISEAIQDATKYKSVSGNTRAVLDDVFSDLAGREGDKAFTQLTPAEQFDRILEAKQRLGKAVKWASKNELPEGQQILSNTYAKFQGMLQKLDDMAAADKSYTGFKQLENNLFKKLGTVERGRIKEFDPIKMEKLFSGSASGRGLMAQVEKAKQMLNDGLLPPEQAQTVQAFLDKIEEMGSKASLKREMGAFRYGDAGPSSPAIQRVQAIAGKDSAVTSAVQAPQMFLNMKATAADSAKSMFGRPFSQLNTAERQAVGKFSLWITQNPGATDVDIKRKVAELVSGLGKKALGSSFAGGTTLDDLGDFAAQRAVKYGADQAYNAVTGEEEGAPDPMKDKIVQVMTDKYNLSEQEQKVLRRLLPGVYDMAGMVKGKTNQIVRKDKYKPTAIQQSIGADAVTPENQVKAIQRYTGAGAYDFHPQYGTINDPEADNKWMKDLYKTLAKPDESIRAVSKDTSFAPNPASIVRKHRPTSIDELKDLQDAKVGEVFVTDRPKSFSHEVKVDGDKNLRGLNLDPKHDNVSIVVRNNSKGLNIENLSKPEMKYEAETLVPEGVEYRVVKNIEGPYGHRTIEIEEVGSSAKPEDEPEWLKQFISERSFTGSSFNGGNTLSGLGDFAAQKAVRYGAEQAYTAATGEESAPDPMKDKIVQVMTDKYNLSEQEQKVLRRLLPGVYDMAGMVKGKAKSGMIKDFKLPKILPKNLKSENEIRQPRFVPGEDGALGKAGMNVSRAKTALKRDPDNLILKQKLVDAEDMERELRSSVTSKQDKHDLLTAKLIRQNVENDLPENLQQYQAQADKQFAEESVKTKGGAVMFDPLKPKKNFGFTHSVTASRHEGIHKLIADVDEAVPNSMDVMYKSINDRLNKYGILEDLFPHLKRSGYQTEQDQLREPLSWLDTLLTQGDNAYRKQFIKDQLGGDIDAWKVWSTKAKKAYKDVTGWAESLTTDDIKALKKADYKKWLSERDKPK